MATSEDGLPLISKDATGNYSLHLKLIKKKFK